MGKITRTILFVAQVCFVGYTIVLAYRAYLLSNQARNNFGLYRQLYNNVIDKPCFESYTERTQADFETAFSDLKQHSLMFAEFSEFVVLSSAIILIGLFGWAIFRKLTQ